MFTIEMLPAEHGDCLWIEYGSSSKPHRVLIDVGTDKTYEVVRNRISRVNGPCRFELLVISHIDADHIAGAVKLLNRLPADVTFADVWFNGWQHLPGDGERLGAAQAEGVSASLIKLKLPWNKAFKGKAVAIDGRLPKRRLPGGLTLTLLSPTLAELRDLRPKWESQCKKAKIVPGAGAEGKLGDRLGTSVDVKALAREPFMCDTSESNGSSIALLAEYKGKSALLCGDAFPTVIEQSVDQLLLSAGESHLRLDACKIAHHGSKSNTSPSLLGKLRSRRFLVSTSGASFDHPDDVTIARILMSRRDPIELYFNYSSDRNKVWNTPGYQARFRYRAFYPAAGSEGATVTLS